MNDPQRPFLLDGVWHYYYLYNEDYPDGNGTEWYHATSTDLMNWTDHGVAIEKYTTGLGDIWTGTAVVDEENTAGFGAGAVIAVVTQQVDGVQRQSLFVSTDGGYNFEPYDGNPVMDNPGVRDFRDPRVIWDAEHRQWVMALAEGGKVGFYTSPDLKQWDYASSFEAPDLGILECPDLFPMAVDGDPLNIRWILMAGANGAAENMTTGTVYWTGSWDGGSFTADPTAHQWLDRGADYYAAVTWDDPRLPTEERLTERYSIGWLNNWAYAGQLPTTQWHGGSDTLVRTLTLTKVTDRLTLTSRPLDALASLEGTPQPVERVTLTPDNPHPLPDPGADAYRLRAEFDADASAGGEARIRIPRGDGTFATVGYDFATQTAFVARDADAIAATMPDAYRTIRTVHAPPREGRVRLDIVVDVGSVEVFLPETGATLSMISLGTTDAAGLDVQAVRAEAVLREASVTPLVPMDIARRAVSD
jgi:levanbiose-producing levanase